MDFASISSTYQLPTLQAAAAFLTDRDHKHWRARDGSDNRVMKAGMAYEKTDDILVGNAVRDILQAAARDLAKPESSVIANHDEAGARFEAQSAVLREAREW